MSDKLPRLNYLTMYSSVLQYHLTGNSDQESILEYHLIDIWKTLSEEDRTWIVEHNNLNQDTVEHVNHLIELVYSENDTE